VWAEPEPRGALASYLRAVRAHRLLVAAVVLAIVGASLVGVVRRTPEYKSTAQLVINPLPQTDDALLGLPVIRDSGDPTRTIQTAATLLESSEAAGATARRLGTGWTKRLVLDRIDIEPAGESNILDVTARAGSEVAAARLANTFVAATLNQRNAALRHKVTPIIDRLTLIRAGLPRDDPSVTDLESRITQLAEVAVGGDPTAQLSRPATSSSSAEGAPSWLIVLLALVGGVVLASVAAFFTELLGPRTIRAEEELKEVHAGPVLAQIPKARSRWPRRRRASPLAAEPAVLASFRSLELQLRMQKGEHHTILFTSPSAGDGRTTCVIDFAMELASAEQRVILIDLDLHQPSLSHKLGIVGETDLRLALAQGAALSDALVPMPDLPMVSVVPGHPAAAAPTLEQVGLRLPDLIAEARSRADFVLIDTSPLGEVGDALRFIHSVDDIVLVARLNHTRVAGVEVVRDLLLRAGKPATGYILVGEDRASLNEVRRPLLAEAPQPPGEAATASPTEAVSKTRAAAKTTSITDLVAAGLLAPDAELVASSQGQQHIAHIRGKKIELNGTRYRSLSAAAASITGRRTDGWTFWQTRVADKNVPLAKLREELRT
jgi:Mrp family chromosome partitioning ATPase